MFDFGDISKNEKAIRKTWDEFRNALASADIEINDIEAALNYTFLKVFDDLYEHMNMKMQTVFSNMNLFTLVRSTKLKPEEGVPNYNRMLPDASYITEDNRFSPPGIEWLYLSIGNDWENALSCAKSECRIKKDDRFASCLFKTDIGKADYMLIDLTVADDLSIEYVNDCLEIAGEKYKSKLMKKSIKLGMPVSPSAEDKRKINEAIEMWAFRTYMKLLSEQIFLPLDETDDKKLMYAPFQCLAQYFISKGAKGIIYKSTVYENGRNIVLFDKTYAFPTGKIIVFEPKSK